MVLLIKGYYGLIQIFADLCSFVLRKAEKSQFKALMKLTKEEPNVTKITEEQWNEAYFKSVLGTDILVKKDTLDKYQLFVDNYTTIRMINVVHNIGKITMQEYTSMYHSYTHIARLYFILSYKWFGHDQAKKIEEYRDLLGNNFVDNTRAEINQELADILKD